MRLFAAIRPPEPVLDQLELALSVPRNGIGAQLRWTPRDQLHITVAFFGDVPRGAVDEVLAGLTEIADEVDPLALSLRGAGTFAGRSLWVGVGGDTDRLTSVMRAGSRIDYADQREAHRAHLTVARPGRRSHGTDLAAMVHSLAVYSGPTWTATGIDLLSSELGKGRGGGPLHEYLASTPFRAPADGLSPER